MIDDVFAHAPGVIVLQHHHQGVVGHRKSIELVRWDHAGKAYTCLIHLAEPCSRNFTRGWDREPALDFNSARGTKDPKVNKKRGRFFFRRPL